MINLNIICVGKIKEQSFKNICDEYMKRISKYSKITVTQLQDEKVDKLLSTLEIDKIKNIECERILEKINKIGKTYIISLDLKGKKLTSKEFADKINNITTYHSSNITFVIGGSLGLNDKIIKMSDEVLSFSTFTFPHQLIRIFLTEQIFRAFKILNNETYHH